MFCDSCGALGESGDLVCLSCGRELPPASQPKAPSPPAAAGAEPKPASNEWLPDPVVAAPVPVAPAVAPEHPCPVHPELPVGGTCPRCGKFVCIRCAPKLTEGNAHCSDCLARLEPAEDEGIGGWLILPAVSVVLTPLGSGLTALMAFNAGSLFIGIVQLAVTLFAVPVAMTFFGRKKSAPLLMIAFYVCVAIAGVASGNVNYGTGMTAVWIVYFLVSKRVKRTFVK